MEAYIINLQLNKSNNSCGPNTAQLADNTTHQRTSAPATQTQHQVECGLLLDVVVSQGAAILQLLAGEDEALLVRGNALLVLDLALHILDGVRRLHLKSDGLAGQGPAGRKQNISHQTTENGRRRQRLSGQLTEKR